eukprot:Opistho-2@75280
MDPQSESDAGPAPMAVDAPVEVDAPAPASETEIAPALAAPAEMVKFFVIYAKKKFEVEFALDKAVSELKAHLEPLSGVPQAMQKLMFKGMMKDTLTLRAVGVNAGAKIMLVGSTVNDIISVTVPQAGAGPASSAAAAAPTEVPLCEQTEHKKVLDKGKPDDVMPGRRGTKESLPQTALVGIHNKAGQKVRLTFKLEMDQLWLSTKERTEKLPLTSIGKVVSEPIKGEEDYHIVALQLGPTEKSRYWLYWVPAQYVDAIKLAVLGNWQI